VTGPRSFSSLFCYVLCDQANKELKKSRLGPVIPLSSGQKQEMNDEEKDAKGSAT